MSTEPTATLQLTQDEISVLFHVMNNIRDGAWYDAQDRAADDGMERLTFVRHHGLLVSRLANTHAGD